MRERVRERDREREREEGGRECVCVEECECVSALGEKVVSECGEY